MSIRSSRPRRASISAMVTNDSPERSSAGRGASISGPNSNNLFTSAKPSSPSSKQPARSFSSQSPLTTSNPAQYSSEGVREQTAELASYTFTRHGSVQDTSHQPTPPPASNSSHFRTQSDTQTLGRPQAQRANEAVQTGHLPETIPETSEPASPESSHPSTPHAPQAFLNGDKKSGISNLFQQLSSYGAISQQRRSSENQDKDTNRQQVPEIVVKQTEEDEADEQQPLLDDRQQDPFSKARSSRSTNQDSLETDVENQKPFRRKQNHFRQILNEAQQKGSRTLSIATHPREWSAKSIWQHGVKQPISLIPCVFLGLLLNVLDALSYGMILFPLGEPIFAATGADGISMFYVSCIVAQLIYSSGGSVFKGAVGSEMIEVVPFFHKMVYTILEHTGKSNPHVVLATTITAFAMSSVLTGVVFFTLGALKLGSLVSFFPRHILIGCIGGVGFFLFVTGIEVSARLDGNLEYNLKTFHALFQGDTVALWTIPLALSIFLLIVQRFNRAPWVVPAFFILVAVVFYIVVVATTKFNVPLARDNGWIFAAPEAGVPFYNFYSYYDFGAVDWNAIGACVPSMFALTFFGVLHVPINIPALAIAAEEDDLNLNRELVAHGFSNAISGFLGSIQNYLVYVNSQMFIQNGGNSRLAGFMLAAATTGVWIEGPVMIGYVPVMVVGALIFYLGIELLEEALWDPMGKMSKLEYLTVLVIVLVMGVYDFVAGILVGIVLACLNFVVQTSRKSAIRASYSGEVVESTVRRHPIQRHFLHEVGYQIYVTKLAGFLFFGSIVRVEKQTRALIEEEAFNRDPIRYLIFDLAHVDGIDFSAAEAFSRMERVLARRQVKMIMSGVSKQSDVGKSLRSVGLWKDESSVRFFETLNNALEYSENELLRAFYTHKDAMDSWGSTRHGSHGSLDMPKAEAISTSQTQPGFSEHSNAIASSPRQRYLQEAATTTLEEHVSLSPKKWHSFKQPLPLILQTFQELTTQNEDFWFHAVSYFERRDYVQGTVLFSRGQEPDGFYLLESGILHAHYTLPMGQYQESIVAGTTCGELPFFSKTTRTATVVAEKDCVAWRLSKESWERMQKEWPEGATEILQVAMKLTKERFDGVVSYVLTTAG